MRRFVARGARKQAQAGPAFVVGVTQRFTSSQGSGTTHFGFREVETDRKKGMVHEVFANVADNYDLMNDLMSGFVHRAWKDSFVSTLAPELLGARGEPVRCLDVAGGTGDISFRIAKRLRQSSQRGAITVCDINPSMLKVGVQRARQEGFDAFDAIDQPLTEEEAATAAAAPAGLTFVAGDAEKLPFDDNSFDSYTIAFGIRNVTDVPAALREAQRVLRPGGRFLCLEFSRVRNPVMAQAYDAFSFNVIPTMGQIVAQDRDSYQYLVESIRQFPDQETFAGMIQDAGFMHVSHRDLTFGVAAVHSGFKPIRKPGAAAAAAAAEGSQTTEAAASDR